VNNAIDTTDWFEESVDMNIRFQQLNNDNVIALIASTRGTEFIPIKNLIVDLTEASEVIGTQADPPSGRYELHVNGNISMLKGALTHNSASRSHTP